MNENTLVFKKIRYKKSQNNNKRTEYTKINAVHPKSVIQNIDFVSQIFTNKKSENTEMTKTMFGVIR